MIRSEHTGTSPLSSQLLQKAHQALKNDGKVTAKELHELRQELGPNPTQDELTFIANLDNPDVIAAVSLLEKGGPVRFGKRRSEAVDDILRKSIQNFQADRPFLARSIQKI